MTESGVNDTLAPGEIRFVDNYVPGLEAGHYTITVTQSLEGSGAYQADRWFEATQEFVVRGPRFRLDPADIHAVFPPSNSQGVFGHDLPHVVLSKRALPWERSISGDEAVPWMALLLFDASQILPPVDHSNADSEAPNPTGVTTIPVKDLLAPEPKVLAGRYDLATLDEGEMQQSCQVFDIEPQIFQAVMPSPDDAKYLAHCREVNLAPKAVPGPARPGADVAPGNGTAWYSVVVGGRFPARPATGQAGSTNVVHLVSLEGFEDYLDAPRQAEDLDGFDSVRLVSLASWAFTCLPERGESFSELMLGLVAGGGKETLEFRLPAPPPGPDATQAESFAAGVLAAGYVPCSYQTRQGERTFAWYRGPFVPQPVARLPADRAPFLTAAQAMVYDQEHGLFDHSYAVAWEMGRLLALSDQRFGVGLLNWRRKIHRVVDRLHEPVAFGASPGAGALTGGLAADAEPPSLESLLGTSRVADSFMSHLLGRFAEEIEPVIFAPSEDTPAEPVSVSGPPPTGGGGMSLAALYQDGRPGQLLSEADSKELGPICDWLSHLYLLYGVPFENLVAHEGLLPAESVRFFYLDRNWLEGMQDGALSIGIQSGRDTWAQQALYGAVRDRVQERIHDMRDGLLGNDDPSTVEPGAGPSPTDHGDGPLAGLLLRSAVVSGWPGLEVRAYRRSDGEHGSEPVGLLRMDRPSADVLLCLFAQVPAWIEFDEPKEGLHFGVEVIDGEEKIGLRNLDDPDAGKLRGAMVKPVRDEDEPRRLDLPALRDRMKAELELDDDGELGPAAFALQMVKVPEQMVFQTAQTG